VAQTRKRSGRAVPKPPAAPRKLGAVRPALLAAGLGLFWFVEHQDVSSDLGAPMWGYLVMHGIRAFVDFVGAWFVVSALQLTVAALRYGAVYLKAHRQTAVR
jgi:hypothetical protein